MFSQFQWDWLLYLCAGVRFKATTERGLQGSLGCAGGAFLANQICSGELISDSESLEAFTKVVRWANAKDGFTICGTTYNI